jgi:hypothetical protein
MLFFIKATILFLFLSGCFFTRSCAQLKISIDKHAVLQRGFQNVPDSIYVSTYWYWVSGHISKDGVIKDLKAMKEIGINRAFIANVTWGEKHIGAIELFSVEWWDILHTALKTAGELNIEIGIFNCPGWSQSGGPWVRQDQAMRYLNSSEITLTGPALLQRKLNPPDGVFQDVKVIAYPAPKKYYTNHRNIFLNVNSTPKLVNLEYLTDANTATVCDLPSNTPIAFEFAAEHKDTVRSLTIYTASVPVFLRGEIQVEINNKYQSIKSFTVDRSNDNLRNGFRPYGEAVISVPAIEAKNIRIILTSNAHNSGIAEIKFSSVPFLENYQEKTLAKMWPNGNVDWTAYQWLPQPVIADIDYVIDPVRVLDISKNLSSDGILTWNVPPGRWIVERCGMSPTLVTNVHAVPEGTGYEVDKMSTEGINAHFDAFMGEIKRRIPAEDRKTWKVIVADSYETGSQNWTDLFAKKFKLHYGYDPIPYMPVFRGKVVGSADQSDRFLWDVRRFIADKVASEYVLGLKNISRKNGFTLWLENYGHYGFPAEFLQYGGAADEVSGEFWNEGIKGDIENRAASSCAHIYGKRKVSSESFTTTDNYFLNYPSNLKPRLDRSFAAGINNILLHVFIHQPYEDKVPGMNAYFGTEFNRKNTWYYDMDDFLKYIKRCSFLLQEGNYAADVAYFIGEDVPKVTGIQEPRLPHGYSFDYINGDVIKERLKVHNGDLVLPDGMKYKLLVLPRLETMRPELLKKIMVLIDSGARVLGSRPFRSPSLENFGNADRDITKMTIELWGDLNTRRSKFRHYGKGIIFDGLSIEDTFKMLKINPDVRSNTSDSLLFIHRKSKECEIYFIANQQNRNISVTPEFRVTNKTPELWNAVNGSIRILNNFSKNKDFTAVPIQLAPYESIFVVFRKPFRSIEHNSLSNYPKISRHIDINGKWKVRFEQSKGGPSSPVFFNSLLDWTQSENDSIKFYSGTAYYTNSFQFSKLKKGERALLNIGNISIAKVKVNGKLIGGVWSAPYKIDITNAVKSGGNHLEIKVVNNWINRIIGDRNKPDAEKITWLHFTSSKVRNQLQSSGLMGPVRIEIMK